MSEHVAVLGAGNIAQALAGHLASGGREVRVYNRWPEEIGPLQERGAIELSGAVEGKGYLELVSTRIEEVVPGAAAVFVATPAFAHRHMAEVCAPLLREDQLVLLHPGTFGSSLEFARHAGRRALVVESAASLYIARIGEPGRVRVLTLKREIQVAALPASRTAEAIERLAPLFPGGLTAAANVLETGLNNNQAAIHCPTVLFNLARVEGGEEWRFWRGISEGVARTIGALDAERLALGRALGFEPRSLERFFEQAYGLAGVGLLEGLHQVFSRGGGALGPADRGHRYIWEDVPYALVPWTSVARQLGVPMPATESLIDLFDTSQGERFRTLGRTVETMGLAGLSAAEMCAAVEA